MLKEIMLEKQITIDKIEVVENDIVQVRQATSILEDGKELSKTYHRWSFQKGDDISEQDAKVQAVCNAVWGE
jgi:hypothetical protein